MFGPGDLAASLGMPHTAIGAAVPGYPGDGWHHVLGRILVAARAAGVQAIDGPYAVIADLDGLAEAAARTRALGFDGKWSIHPSQIALLNAVYGVGAADLDRARRVLEAHAAAAAAGAGAADLDGEMIDEATRRMAETVMERARLTGGRLSRRPVRTTCHRIGSGTNLIPCRAADQTRILIVEEASGLGARAAEALRAAGHEIEAPVVGAGAVRDALAGTSARLVVAVCSGPEGAGRAVLDEFVGPGRDTTCVLVCPDPAPGTIVALMRAGAADVVPSSEIARLPVAVARGLPTSPDGSRAGGPTRRGRARTTV